MVNTVDGVRLALTQASTCCGDTSCQRSNACLQQPELGEVAAVEWKVEDFAPGHDTAEGIGR
jgi:hypothetical protein